ncbi:MAG: YihY/virulence factor BrkB family protein [Planctomycetes bacterium]|nr:YihY/virulence factor BrkB family protein [Planctomycetota bacterium]
MKLRAIWQVPKNAVYSFFMDNGFTLAAALAFYAILSIAPLLILLVTLTGLVSDSTGQQIIAQTEKLIGPQASQGVELIVKNAKAQRFAATASAVTGLVILLLSATTAFGQLQSALNAIFNVRWKRGILIGWLYKRLMSLLMVLVVGIVLIATVVVASTIAVAFRGDGRVAQIADLIISMVVFTIIFVIVFRVLPDIKISWRDTWVGGIITGLLFVAGEYGISEYLRTSGTTTLYGAAGSLVVLLLWIYYSSIILLLGAEVTQAYAKCCGHEIVPDEHAEWDSETALRLHKKEEQAQEVQTGVET